MLKAQIQYIFAIGVTIFLGNICKAQNTTIDTVFFDGTYIIHTVSVSISTATEYNSRLEKQGLNFAKYTNGSLKEVGYYRKNLKDGWWQELSTDKSLIFHGRYKKGLRYGKCWISETEYAVYDKWGKIIEKGTGCFNCKKL